MFSISLMGSYLPPRTPVCKLCLSQLLWAQGQDLFYRSVRQAASSTEQLKQHENCCFWRWLFQQPDASVMRTSLCACSVHRCGFAGMLSREAKHVQKAIEQPLLSELD